MKDDKMDTHSPKKVPHELLPEPPEGEEHGLVWFKGKPRRVPLERMPDGAIARAGTYDQVVWHEQEPSYGWLDVEGKVVLDVGVNMGYFSRMALRKGASQVVGFEPDPQTAAMAKINAPELELHESALVYGDETEVQLYFQWNGRNSGSASLLSRRGRTAVTVKADKFATVLNELQPEVLKMDVEGAEYDLMRTALPDSVRQVAMELHVMPNTDADEMALEMMLERFRTWEQVVWNRHGGMALAGWRR